MDIGMCNNPNRSFSSTPSPTPTQGENGRGAKLYAENVGVGNESRKSSHFRTRRASSVIIAVIIIPKPNPFLHRIASLTVALQDVLISSILQYKHTERWVPLTLPSSTPLHSAARTVIERGLAAVMVVDDHERINDDTHQRGKVMGMLTSRDLLRQYGKERPEGEGGREYIHDLEDNEISTFMTPISKVVFCRPHETVRSVRRVMAKVGVKALPILSKVRGRGEKRHQSVLYCLLT